MESKRDLVFTLEERIGVERLSNLKEEHFEQHFSGKVFIKPTTPKSYWTDPLRITEIDDA